MNLIYYGLLSKYAYEHQDEIISNMNRSNRNESPIETIIISELFGNSRELNSDELEKDTEYRKRKIIDLLTEKSEPNAVMIKYKGKKKIVSKKAYDIIYRGALLSPNVKSQSYYINEKRCPCEKYSINTTFVPNRIDDLSFWDKIKIFKKIKAIEKLKISKDPLLYKKGKVKIPIYPISFHKYEGISESHFTDKFIGEALRENEDPRYYTPEAVDYIEIECTPRELAEAGIDYRDLNWELIIENENTRHDKLGHVRNIDTPAETTGNTAVQAGPTTGKTAVPEEH